MLQAGMARIKGNLASSVKKGRMKQEQADAVFGRVTGTLTYDDFKRVDMVIEAAIEVRCMARPRSPQLEAITSTALCSGDAGCRLGPRASACLLL